MREQILGLYETFLGKFEFFHKFIKILLSMNDKLDESGKKLSDVELVLSNVLKEIEQIKEEREKLEERINNIASKDEQDKSTNFSNAPRVMQRQWDLYHQGDNQ